MNKVKAHVRYKTSEGKRCAGVTTILGVMNKPALVKWANNLGLQGIDSSKYVDALANIGTLTHYMVECDVKGETPDLDDYSKNEINVAKGAFDKWLQWKSQHKFEIIGSEMQVVSDKLRVGGTCDIYAMVDGKKTLIDVKTSKATYDEHRTQAVAYAHLLRENGREVENIRIIRIGRNENEGFEDCNVGGEELHWKRFMACLALYEVNRDIKNTGA